MLKQNKLAEGGIQDSPSPGSGFQEQSFRQAGSPGGRDGEGILPEAPLITLSLWSHSAVKVRLSWHNGSSSGPSDFNLDSRLEVLRAGPLPPVELTPTLRHWLQLDAICVHNVLRGKHAGTYVLSGEVQSHQLLVTTAYAWSQGHRNLQLAIRRWHYHRCPE